MLDFNRLFVKAFLWDHSLRTGKCHSGISNSELQYAVVITSVANKVTFLFNYYLNKI